jgi:integrase/recombinase XerC
VTRMGWQLDEFARSLTAVSPSTVEAYSRDLRAFVGWAGRLGLDDPGGVDRLTLRRYLAYMATRGQARRTIARRASALRRYFGWLVRTGRLDRDPTVGLSAPKGEARLPRVLRPDELRALLDDRGRADGAVELRDTALLELLYGSGLRIAEATALDIDDIDIARSGVAGGGGVPQPSGPQAHTTRCPAHPRPAGDRAHPSARTAPHVRHAPARRRC